MDNKEIQVLSKYRLEQSKENLEEAEALFNINKFKRWLCHLFLLLFICFLC